MSTTINAKDLRLRLGEVVAKVQRGGRFTVLYRSRPAFDIVPVGHEQAVMGALESDSLYHAKPVGESKNGLAARQHDDVLYR